MNVNSLYMYLREKLVQHEWKLSDQNMSHPLPHMFFFLIGAAVTVLKINNDCTSRKNICGTERNIYWDLIIWRTGFQSVGSEPLCSRQINKIGREKQIWSCKENLFDQISFHYSWHEPTIELYFDTNEAELLDLCSTLLNYFDQLIIF